MTTPPKIFPGDRFGRLEVIEYAFSNKGRWYHCKCDCTGKRTVKAKFLLDGSTKSCGCMVREMRKKSNNGDLNLKHGHARNGKRSPELSSYASMLNRCTNPNSPKWKDYGGRGIIVCDRWREKRGIGFLNFLEDMGSRPAGTSIDRKNVNGNYEPDNCRWATTEEQARNKRNTYMLQCPCGCGYEGILEDFLSEKNHIPKWMMKILDNEERG